ncbi:hypothetical protein IAT38_000511 [Cryptococcus sp. DSM 104549]
MRIQHLLSLLLLLLAPAIQAAVLAIDYGAEFTKLSLVKPGVPFDVVLDKDSKRKIQSVVGWKREDRVFGSEAKMAATRFPDTHFPYVKPLLGASGEHPLPIYPTSPTLTDDGVLIFPHPSLPSHITPAPTSTSGVWTPTALLAHQLSYFRHLAESLHPAGSPPETISQVIVTVPAWWSPAQRKAYRDALELQGLSCLAMIGEGTGVALNYAMTRTFPTFDPATGEGEKEYHVVYDSGALSTTATVLALYQTSEKVTPKSKTLVNTTHIEVIGTGWEHVGGVTLDVKLQELLTADFVQKSGRKEVVDDKRAVAKLAKEANRVKHILSANYEANVAVESLFDDIDFRSRISRADLESALELSTPLFSSPISSALASSGLSVSDINSFILFGGNTRVPLVQSAIKSILGESDDKIAQNVNTDEAAVLGAAYYGAALSRQFKMKNKVEVKEASVGEIALADGQVIFPEGSTLGEKKPISFPADEDLELEFTYAPRAASPTPLLAVQVQDILPALANFTAPSPIVNLTVRLDQRGFLSVANAVLVSNVTESSGGVAGALKGLFGGKDKEEKKEDGDQGKEEVVVGDGKAEKRALRFKEKYVGAKAMSSEEKRATHARINSVAAYETAKARLEEARNSLEGYIYRLNNFLSPDSDNRSLQEYSTLKEQKALKKLTDESLEWLNEFGETAEEEVLREKLKALETLESPIVFRFTEDHKRGKAVEDFSQAMHAARKFHDEALANTTSALALAASATPEDPVAPPKYTLEELKMVDEMMEANTEWIDRLMEVQVKLDGDRTKDPVVTSAELDERGKRLQATVLRLTSKKTPRRPRPSSSSTTPIASSTTLASPTDHGPEPTLDADNSSSSASPSSTTVASPTDHGPEPTAKEGVEDQTGEAPPDHGPEVPKHEEL